MDGGQVAPGLIVVLGPGRGRRDGGLGPGGGGSAGLGTDGLAPRAEDGRVSDAAPTKDWEARGAGDGRVSDAAPT